MTKHKTSHYIRRAALCAALATAVLLPAEARAELRRGEKSFGPRVGYVGKNNSVSAGLVFQYSLSRRVRLAPEASVIFRNKDMDALSVALNVHVPFGFENDKVALYPLAGVEYVSWTRHTYDSQADKDVTSHSNRFGADVGAGVELRCTSSLKLSLEGRYTFVKSYSTTQVSLGISYIF